MTRMTVILAGLFAALMGLLTWSILECGAKQQSARDARENLDRCRLVMQQIGELRQSPMQASLQALSSTDLTKLLEEAAAKSQILPNSIRSIAPQAPQRQGQTPYQWHSTDVMLAPLTWTELNGFLHSMALREPSVIVSHLKLTTPTTATAAESAARGPELWSVELRLTQSVFAPITPPR